MDGIEQSYFIEESFNLEIINPTEKIIYNPYKVTISRDLTFPCRYKFLTLHGKYPDYKELHHTGDYSKQYWDEILYFNFTHDKDYPIPVHDVLNEEDMSYYILEGCTITIEPYVIIMDAKFEGVDNGPGKGYIVYDPDYTFGNWSFDSQTIELIEIDWDDLPTQFADCELTHDSLGVKTAPINKKSQEDKKIIILNGGTEYPQIQINIDQTQNIYTKVIDSFGNLVLEEKICRNPQVINCSNLRRGVYHIVLIINEEIVEKQSFSKM